VGGQFSGSSPQTRDVFHVRTILQGILEPCNAHARNWNRLSIQEVQGMLLMEFFSGLAASIFLTFLRPFFVFLAFFFAL
jgi:hypothetical protein